MKAGKKAVKSTGKKAIKPAKTAKAGNYEQYRLLFENMPSAFALHKIILKNGKPYDYEFIEVNRAFEKFTGFKREQVIGETVRKIIPGIIRDKTDWIGEYGKVALTGKPWETAYSESMGKSYQVKAYCPEKGYFVALFEDVTERKKLETENEENLNISELRAEIWKVAAEGPASESELVEKIFSIIGPKIDASRLVFSTVVGNDFYAMSEWVAPGVPGRIKGIRVHKKVFDSMDIKGQGIFGKKEAIELFPAAVRPIVSTLIELLIKIAGDKPALITPYKINGETEGEIVATGLTEPVTKWGEARKELLREAAAVITASIQLRRARENQRVAENKMRSLVNNIAGVFVRHYLPEDRAEVTYNDAYSRMMGLPEGYFDTNAGLKFRELIHPDDVLRASETSDNAYRNLPHYYQEYRLKDANGIYFWAAENVTIIRDDKGMPMWADSFIYDISDKKTSEEKFKISEEKFRAAFSASPDFMSITRFSDSLITEANEAFAGRFGFAKEELIGKTTRSLDMWVNPADRDTWLDCIKANKGCADFEVKLKDRYGDEFYAALSAGIMDIKGEKYILTIARDISDRKKAELALAESMNELKRSNEELERFAYVASHDLQEPLRMVSNYLQLIERRYRSSLDAEGHEFIKHAVDGARRMQQLIKDLLSYSRTGSRVLEIKAVDLNKIVSSAVKNLQEVIDESNAVINAQGLPSVPADELQMVQLFQNLIGNGIKFVKKGTSPVIDIAVKRLRNEYVISFTDNGIGIDKAYFDKIFVIFNRLHSRDEYPGTGIGLAVCKRIAEKHRGRMWLESEPGRGSVFYVSLPADLPAK